MLRLTAGVARTLVRSASNVMKMAAPRMAMCQSKTPTKVQETSKLAEKLESEIKYEKDNAPEVSKTIDEIKSKGWEIKIDNTLIELKKQAGDKTVYISFGVRSPQA